MSVTIVGVSSDTPVINYTPNTIDEYIVVVNLPEDWETVHNYIINENDIDGIPNIQVVGFVGSPKIQLPITAPGPIPKKNHNKVIIQAIGTKFFFSEDFCSLPTYYIYGF